MYRRRSILINPVFLIFMFLSLYMPESVFARCSSYAPKKTNQCCFYWGTASIGGLGGVKVGDEVRAYTDLTRVGDSCVGYCRVKEPDFYGSMAVYADDSTSAEKDGAQDGDSIYFTICHDGNEYICNEKVLWNPQNINTPQELNITGSSRILEVTGGKEDERVFTTKDALCAFQTYLGKCPNDCGNCDGIRYDLNKDGSCTPVDALCIYRESMQMPSCLD